MKTAARLYQNMMYEYKDNLSASLILGGHDEIEGNCLYQCAPGGTVIKSNFAIGGSGSGFIYGYCDKFYKDNMSF